MVRRRCAVLALVAGCVGVPADAAFVGPAETFEAQTVGAFPAGWNDFGSAEPDPATPNPSAVVVNTTNAFGNATKALAPVPAVGGIQGIYRAITPSSFYSTRADIRVDQFSDFDPNFDPTTCGCPPGAEVDLAVGPLLMSSPGSPQPAEVQLYPGARSQDWRLFVGTPNAVADLDLGLPVTLGKWYGVQLDLDSNAATARSRITDIATGATLLDTVTSLSALGPGTWNPAVDGIFDIEAFVDIELSAKTTPGLWMLDNIDARVPEPTTLLLLMPALIGAAACRRRNPREV
jgi:hypothetical protein